MTDETEVILAGISTIARGTAFVTPRVRQGLVHAHLKGALHFAEQVSEIERKNSGQAFGTFFESIEQNSIACVFFAVAAIESHINEVFSDRATTFPDVSPDLVEKVWDMCEMKPPLEKFDIALLLLNQKRMEKDGPPRQDVECVMKLRNALIHFKPEWHDEDADHAKLSKQLSGKFDGSPFLQSEVKMFPIKWMSHAGVRWVARSVIEYLKEFERRAGIPSKLTGLAQP